MLPDEGEIRIKGKKIGKDVDFPENTGVLIETPYFSPFSSGYQNLKNLAGIQKKIGPEQIKHAMELVGLDSADKKWVSKYSLGMRQRLGIAQALMEDQDLLILDEPMNGLDKQGVADIRDLILKMKQEGKTILMSSHYPQDMELLCDTIYEVDRGKIIGK
jgi:ABC-2 type transport system ATP-binding protein